MVADLATCTLCSQSHALAAATQPSTDFGEERVKGVGRFVLTTVQSADNEVSRVIAVSSHPRLPLLPFSLSPPWLH